MANATNALEELIGDHLLRDATWSKPSDIYVGLFTVMPEEDGTGGTEVTAGVNYTRIRNGPSDSAWTGPVDGNGLYSNTAIVQFGEPSADWGEIVGYGLFSAEDSGTLYISKAFVESFTVSVGDPAPAFAVGAITVVIA